MRRRALRFLQGLSAESLYNRFLMTPHLDLARARAYVDVDQSRQVVLVAERAGELVGIAGYYRDPARTDWAEVAFAVADGLQGRGLGTRLLERLAEIARARGLNGFEAFVRGENRQMMDVFVQSGFTQTREIEQGTWHVTLSLEPTARLAAASAARARAAATASLRRFFEPRVVAVVGANREPGRIGSEIFRNLRESGFTGTLDSGESRRRDRRRPRRLLARLGSFPARSISPSSSCRRRRFSRWSTTASRKA